MQSLLTLVVTGLLVAFAVRWAARKMKVNVPGRMAVIIVFGIVALALFGHQLGK